MPNMRVTLHPPAATDAWRIQLTGQPPNLPGEIRVMLDGRPYPFHAPLPALPTHPMNLLWHGTTDQSQAILAAVRAVHDGTMTQAQAEAVMAERLRDWSRAWARVHGRIADRRGPRGRR